MSRQRKYILVVALLLVAAMTVYPPWIEYCDYSGFDMGFSENTSHEYSWIFRPPYSDFCETHLDYGRLLLQYLIIGLTSGSFYLLAGATEEDFE